MAAFRRCRPASNMRYEKAPRSRNQGAFILYALEGRQAYEPELSGVNVTPVEPLEIGLDDGRALLVPTGRE